MISSPELKTPPQRLFGLLALSLLAFIVLTIVPSVRADLNPKQARKLITRMPGFELPSGAVRIKSISTTSADATQVTAEIKTVFKFEKDEQVGWRVAEIRTRPDQWENLTLVARALGTSIATGACNAPDPPFKGASAIDPSLKRVRCLLGALLGVEVPSDAVRIQQVSPLSVPLASQPSATVVAWIRVDTRLTNGSKGWQIEAVRTGNREWVKLEPLIASLNTEKQQKVRTDLEAMAKGLEQFRGERGFYVVSEKHSVVIDYLNPRYLAQVIRVDPWHHPYKYEGQRDHFVLSSSGPDGKDNTADDIKLAGPSR
jgi:hypothetical protein